MKKKKHKKTKTNITMRTKKVGNGKNRLEKKKTYQNKETKQKIE